MKCDIITTELFQKEFKRLQKKYPSIKNDITLLEQELLKNPKLGEPIGNDCYKIRMAISSKQKGKSGGARVISFLYTLADALYLIGIYDKSEKETLSDNEIKSRISFVIETLKYA